MGLFDTLFKSKAKSSGHKFRVEMRGFESGKEALLPESAKNDDQDDIDYSAIVSEIKPLEDVMVGFAVALKEKHTVEDEISLLTAIIESFYSLKSKCISLGPDYEKYFSKMWEHCHNSRNPDFSYIEKFEERLDFVQREKLVLLAEEELKSRETESLDKRIVEIIEAEKEILQTDIYKRFDPVVQSEISSILYFMAKDGKIRRVKHGRTYLISFVE